MCEIERFWSFFHDSFDDEIDFLRDCRNFVWCCFIQNLLWIFWFFDQIIIVVRVIFRNFCVFWVHSFLSIFFNLEYYFQCNIDLSLKHQFFWTTISREMIRFVTCIAFLIVSVTLLFIFEWFISFASLSKVQFHWHRFIIIEFVAIAIVETWFFFAFTKMFDENVCFLTRFIITFLHNSLVQLVVEFDCCFNQMIEILEFFVSTNQLVLDIVLEFSAKHNHKNNIVSLDKIDLLLKSDDIIDCWNSLN